MGMELILPIEDNTENLYDRKLADPCAIITHEELADRKIWIIDVDDDLLDKVSRWILYWSKEDKGKPVNERRPIKLYIYSYGGDLEICLQLMSLIKCCKTPVYTYALGVAYSAGAFLFMSGDKRFILPNSSVMIHQGQGGNDGTYDQVQAQTAQYKREIQKLKDFCLSVMDIPKQTFAKKWVKDWYLTAEEAIKYKVATDTITDLEEVV